MSDCHVPVRLVGRRVVSVGSETGKTFYAIGHLTPGAWAMDGLQNIVVRGLGLASVWQPAGILLAYALGFFALAVWRFRAREV